MKKILFSILVSLIVLSILSVIVSAAHPREKLGVERFRVIGHAGDEYLGPGQDFFTRVTINNRHNSDARVKVKATVLGTGIRQSRTMDISSHRQDSVLMNMFLDEDLAPGEYVMRVQAVHKKAHEGRRIRHRFFYVN